jgi:hypothetical protein
MGRVQIGERYLDCHIHVDTLVSSRRTPVFYHMDEFYFTTVEKNFFAKLAPRFVTPETGF